MKIKNRQLLLTLPLTLLVVVTSSLLGQGNSQQVAGTNNTERDVDSYLQKSEPNIYKYLQNLLNQALQDAEKPQNDKVTANLWSLSINNPRVKSRTIKGVREYRMVTWMNLDGRWEGLWQSQTGKKYVLPAKVWWLTAVPQVQEFCQNCKGTGLKIPGNIMLNLRVQQYLGLRIEPKKSHFVEMWVKEKDLVRPCIDREINDSACRVLPGRIPSENVELINIKKGTVGYPWTGLGYTYDWGNPQKPHVGASEFVAIATPQKQVEVEVISVTPTKEYCQNQYLK
ncbi:MAG: hypothetical protein WBV73_27210 [Phormidium sp.]